MAQESTTEEKRKERLDFATTYFEIGGSFFPSFTGVLLQNNELVSVENAESVIPHINWGGFHFWGHAEFFITVPLKQFNFGTNETTDFQLTHSVVTGMRLLPWAFEEKKLRPYVGLSWSGLDFQQKEAPDGNQPVLTNNFVLAKEAGVLFGYKQFALRLGVTYFGSNKWNYPVSKTRFGLVEAPKYNIQVGLNYSYEGSHAKVQKTNDRWNGYPAISSPGLMAKRAGDFFVGIAPSFSFGLSESDYTNTTLPFLDKKPNSSMYADIAVGYQFYKLGLFTAASFRSPVFKTEGYGVAQTVKKKSFALEVNKYLTDYSGFAPFVGLNMAFDQLEYIEQGEGADINLTFRSLEPGISFGWDIIPGKTDEALILRTNLRWYPKASFEVGGKAFDFSQLEYNLIQAVFYPGRLKAKHPLRNP